MNIRWGIIGCGNVTERKSGPAFYTLKNSSLVAVMRRDREKAKDFALRHNVPWYYDNAEELLHNPEVDAVYVATPPDTHAKYSTMAMKAGKPVYVEKPMATTYSECLEMIKVSEQTGMPLFVAYYRRAQRYFRKVKEIISSGVLGDIRFVEIKLVKPPGPGDKLLPLPWRLKPEISGGGYFVDVASHQIDLLQWFFGPIKLLGATVQNIGRFYEVEDFVAAHFITNNEAPIVGNWCFCGPENNPTDSFKVTGHNGVLSFSTFSYAPIVLQSATHQVFRYKSPHIAELDMVSEVNMYIRNNSGPNPSDLASAAVTTRLIVETLGRYSKQPKA